MAMLFVYNAEPILGGLKTENTQSTDSSLLPFCVPSARARRDAASPNRYMPLNGLMALTAP